MAQDANTAVYQGREGTGAAQILGGYIDPLKVMMANQAKDEARAAAEKAAKRKARTDALKEQEEWKPGARWDIDEQEIRTDTRNFLQWYAGELQKGRPVNEVNMEAREKKDAIEVKTAKSRSDKENYDRDRKFYEANKNYLKPEILEDIDDLYMDENGMGMGIMNRNTKNGKILFDNTDRYLTNNIFKDFVDSLPEQGHSYFKTKWDKLGKTYEKHDINGLFYQLDDNNEVVLRNGKPVLNLSDEVIDVARQNPWISKLIDANVSDDDPAAIKKYLESQMFQWAGNKYKQTPSGTSKYPANRGNGNYIDDYQMTLSDDIDYRDWDTAMENKGIAGKKTVSFPTPNLVKDVYLQDNKDGGGQKMDIEGFEQDSEGNKYIKATYRVSGDQVQEVSLPYNEKTLAGIRNNIKDTDLRSSFDKRIKEFNMLSQKAQDTYINQPLLKESSRQILQNVNNPDGLKRLMKELGVENYKTGTSWGVWEKGGVGQPFIEIDGDRFYVQEYENGQPKWKIDDTEALNKFLYNLHPDKFTTDDPFGIKSNSVQQNGNTGGQDDPFKLYNE